MLVRTQRKESLQTLLVGNRKWYSPCGIHQQFLKKLNIDISSTQQFFFFDPAILFIHTQTCTWVFTAALFIIVEISKQQKYSAIDEWINKMWCIYAVEYYWVIKRNEGLICSTTWMNFRNIMLNESILYNPTYIKCPLQWLPGS